MNKFVQVVEVEHEKEITLNVDAIKYFYQIDAREDSPLKYHVAIWTFDGKEYLYPLDYNTFVRSMEIEVI